MTRIDNIPAEPSPSTFTVLVDSREELPFTFEPMPSKVAGLQTADYSIEHLEQYIAIERKSLPDLLCCVTGKHEKV